MEHADAPAGKSLKYALHERERRFLLSQPLGGRCVRRAQITDRYIVGTRIRLRETVETTTAGTTTVRKLTQKIPGPSGEPGLITTLYLSEAEHAVFQRLPAATLTKMRYSVPPFGVDVFEGELAGLVVAEIELVTALEEAAFPAPPECVAEVTRDPRFTGGRYTTTTRDELLELLAEHGIGPVDASELAARELSPDEQTSS